MRRFTLALAALLTILGPAAHAADDPISGQRLTLKSMRDGTGKLVFTSRDPGLVVPEAGSADDPRTSGARVELFLADGNRLFWILPAQGAEPGWSAPANPPSYRYANRKPVNGQVGTLRLTNNGRRGALNVTLATVAFPSPIERVGIRLTMGAQRSCAYFDVATVKRDTSTTFLAANAPDTRLADCSDLALSGAVACGDAAAPECAGSCPGELLCSSDGGAGCACVAPPTPTPPLACHLDDSAPLCFQGACPDGSTCGPDGSGGCTCISASQPCGDTAPVCNGQCPSGEVCLSTGGLPGSDGCACLPEGSTGCSVAADPQCGGDCPDGLTCNSIFYHLGFTYCQCMSGGCGPGGAPCPPGTRCMVGPPGFPSPRCEPF